MKNNLTLYEIQGDLLDLLEMINNGEAYNDDGSLNEVFEEQLQLTKKEFDNKAVSYGYVIKSLEDKEELFDKEIKRLQSAKKYYQNSKERVKQAITEAMIKFGIEKVEGERLTLSLRKSTSVDIVNIDELPDEFKRTKIEILPDKVKIKNAITKDGEKVQGAELVERKNLQIK